MSPAARLLALLLASSAPHAAEPAQTAQSGGELRFLHGELVALRALIEERLAGVEAELAELRRAVSGPGSDSLAGPFLASPPASSDAVGVARVPVFRPRLAVDSAARHDVVFLEVFRLEPSGRELVGRLELGRDPDGVALPVDRNGALYLVSWSTSIGYDHELQLRDGLSGLLAATARVKPQEPSGSFLLVGYSAE